MRLIALRGHCYNFLLVPETDSSRLLTECLVLK